MFGGADGDVILGQDGDDLARGGDGNDLIIDGSGADDLRGDAGDDFIIASGFQNDDAMLDLFLHQPANVDVATTLYQVEADFSQDTDTAGDRVSGGAGNDIIFFGTDDTVTGGDGADLLILGDWVEGSAPATITDFDSSEDVLMYYGDSSGPAPSLSVQYTYDGSGNVDESLLYSNGHLVVRVTSTGNPLTLNDVILTAY